MKENWNTSFERVLKSEGGFKLTTLQGDAGGQTYAGIARVPNPQWEGWTLIDQNKTPPDEMVMKFYKAAIWDRVKGDELPTGVDYLVFDFAVNAGPRQATMLLQRAVGAREDGVIGPATIAAVKAHDPVELLDEYAKKKEEFYHEIVKRRPENARFIKGWLNRVAHVGEIAKTMVA